MSLYMLGHLTERLSGAGEHIWFTLHLLRRHAIRIQSVGAALVAAQTEDRHKAYPYKSFFRRERE